MAEVGRGALELSDSHGRRIRSLRISVIDRCNLRCRYCVPSRHLAPSPRQLPPEALVNIARVAVRRGVSHVRLTGGEPLLRPELPEIIRGLKAAGVADVALTTNGVLLGEKAAALAKAGVDRVTVSVDSLRPERFSYITQGGRLDDVWQGLRIAEDVGLRPVKINVVVMGGINDDELDDWVKLVDDRALSVRFLELMPIGDVPPPGRPVNLAKLRRELVARTGLVGVAGPGGNGPARYFQRPGAAGTIGFITPVSDDVCSVCSRLRLTAEGLVRPCLAHDTGVDLHDAAIAGDDAAIEAGLARAVEDKPLRHGWESGRRTVGRMVVLGG